MKPAELASRLCAQSFRFLPTNQVSRVWGRFTHSASSKPLVWPFARVFRIETREAELPLSSYGSLNEFFTRRLRPGARPIDPDPGVMVSPVDGRVSAAGACDGDRLLQIKGSSFDLFSLLRDNPMARRFEGGDFVTLYLSPQDYHRIHAPGDLSIHGLGYMPGVLLPVNPPSVRWIDGLYTQNERVMVYADSPAGAICLVAVGANCVGSIKLFFHDFLTNRPGVGPTRLNFSTPVSVKKGAELGMFEMGSTVVLLFEKGRVDLKLPELFQAVRMGQGIGRIKS
jgi:phosphatidylserine decarboxylase